MLEFLSDVSPRASVALAGLLAVVTGCSTIETGSHYDETTDFGRYESWAWIADDPHIPTDDDLPISPLTHAKIADAIAEQLLFKGYTMTGQREQADFVVSYSVGSRDKLRVSAYPVAYRGPWGWHVPGSRYYVTEQRAHSYTEGTLAVDIFDAESKRPVWHGWAGKTITASDRKNPGEVIQRGVARLLAPFPRSGGAVDADDID